MQWRRVQEKFGQETVNIALDVTLKVGMRREKLQSIMLSDHFINYTMSTETSRWAHGILELPNFWKPHICSKKIRHKP